jgi:hypothetical protein
MLQTLLRLPSPGFPKDMPSGDPRVDAYLETLDSALAGSAAVRRRTLLEARDYLMETLERARAERMDENTALSDAINDFGQAEHIGREQRRERAALFWHIAWPTGLGFATLMLLFSLLGVGATGTHWQVLASAFVFAAVSFGLSMGYFGAYLVAQPMPTRRDISGSAGFTVRYPRLSIQMAWLLVLGFGTMQIMLAAGLAGTGPMDDWPAAGTLLLLLINSKTILAAIDALMFDAVVDADTLRLAGLGGRATIKRGQIASVTAPGIPFQLIWPLYPNMRRLSWRDDMGRSRHRHVSFNRELVQGDRLLAWVESAASENAADSSAACNA